MKIEEIYHLNDKDLLKLEQRFINSKSFEWIPILNELDLLFIERFQRKFAQLAKMPYEVEITEVLQITTTVFACTAHEAIRQVKEQYQNEIITLSADELKEVEIECIDDMRINVENIRELFE